MTDKQAKFIIEVTTDPSLPWDEAAIRAGYSKKRAKSVASMMKRHSGVQGAIQAIFNRKLQAAPTLESYHATLNSAKEAALRSNSSTSAWVLFQIANLEAREVLSQAEPDKGKQGTAVLVKFVGTPEEAEEVNRGTAEFEAREQLPSGFLGRVEAQAETELPEAPTPAPVEPKPKADVIPLPISLERRKHLERVCMPLGGALSVKRCHVHGVSYESEWVQSASREWGWSTCPRCAMVN